MPNQFYFSSKKIKLNLQATMNKLCQSPAIWQVLDFENILKIMVIPKLLWDKYPFIDSKEIIEYVQTKNLLNIFTNN